MPAKKTKNRCKWAESNELLAAYHDVEWGVPVHDDRLLFEMLNLEGAQAGLSWLTILKKRAIFKDRYPCGSQAIDMLSPTSKSKPP
jgi:3-methyladenine DNA glycosylase Tag